ncbi:hypothetical protein BO85DRAFT_491847 [Aspergillus piperis CBS 112811]|uniref:F-box domain-containing protein n=1 Tax=Aspergillus piperis CBS 112811 TaxID=1448313 RepID=A0A8G1VIX8_9EURO|nr:hypothetical protein BO85DRAFT_491847 [Aspergillus piperis CBS 112811]RAH53722.1 hypothetical protein BO85DRAFT_491847 [Aspergillus piperis CBS 112811]
MDVLDGQKSPLCVAWDNPSSDPDCPTDSPTTPGEDNDDKGHTVAQAALAIPEIVEMILIRLGFADLLRMEQVCRSWQFMMRGSIIIRRALFFEQSSASYNEEPALNPFFKKWFCPACYCKNVGGYFVQRGPSGKFAWFEDAKLREIVLYEKASWRRMWPSTVPVVLEAVSLHTRRQDPGPGISDHVVLKREHSLLRSDTNGMTLSGFLEAMISLMNHSKSPEFTVFWKKTAGNSGRPRWQLIALLNPSQLMSPRTDTKPIYPGISKMDFAELLNDDELSRFLSWTEVVDDYYNTHVDW